MKSRIRFADPAVAQSVLATFPWLEDNRLKEIDRGKRDNTTGRILKRQRGALLPFRVKTHDGSLVSSETSKHCLPKNQPEVESLIKDLDLMVCKTMNYYNNMPAIYNYLIKVFKGEILINKL